MKDEVAKLVLDIRVRAMEVTSLVATYRSVSRSELMPIENQGTVRFLAPDRFRAEAVVNNYKTITIRVGTRVETYLPQRNEAWRYDLKDMPPLPGFSPEMIDFRDPFAWIEEESLHYGGETEIEGLALHRFTAAARRWVQQGMLDTRKGFSIPYRQQTSQLSATLFVAVVSGLLRRRVVVDKIGKEVAQLDFIVEAINAPLDEGLFHLEVPSTAYKRISITDTLKDLMDPNSAEAPPSTN